MRLLDKTPPHSIEAEQSVIASMLIDQDALLKVIDNVNIDDFYKRTHQWMMRALTKKEVHFIIEAIIESFSLKKRRCKQELSLHSVNGELMITPRQNQKILAQMHSLGWDKKTIEEFALKICKKAVKDLTKKLAGDFIEALKVQETRQKEHDNSKKS